MENCLFCKIIEGKIPATKVFDNGSVIAFKDITPQAKIHYLFIHKDHTKDINEISETASHQFAEVYKAIAEVSKNEKLDNSGFRVVTNLGAHAGQTVFHTHFHLLGGEPLGGFGR